MLKLAGHNLPHMHVRVRGGVREIYLGKLGDFRYPPLFTIEAHPPKEIKMTQGEWDDATVMCVAARVKGQWYGDILQPFPMEAGMIELLQET